MNRSAKNENSSEDITPLRLLILDDEPAIVLFLKSLMLEEGFQVFEFTDPGEAIAELPNIRPHLVLVDWIMSPNCGGGDFLRKLRQFDKEVPVIVVSGYASEMTQEEKKCLEECNVSEILPKSLNMHNARERILSVITTHYPKQTIPTP